MSKPKKFIDNGIKGYYETVKGINWISGYAIKKILERGPAVGMFYMGMKDKPGIIYDLAYSPEETIEIGLTVAKALHKPSTYITSGKMSDGTAASLWYEVQKNYPNPAISQIYKIEIPVRDGQKPFDEWCMYVKGRLSHTNKEKIDWYKEWIESGN